MIINTATLVEDYDHIYSADPALETSGDDFPDLYRQATDLGDASLLPLKNGQKPAVWKLKHPRGKANRVLRSFLARTTSPTAGVSLEAIYVACQIGLAGVENLRDQNNNLIELKWTLDTDIGIRVVSEETMQVLDAIDDGALVNELGLRVVLRLVPSKK